MIKLQSAHIEEVRGIRKLDIEFGGKTVAVWGPNGSGKSGVIDAIEFALTGQIARLTGPGTKGLSVGEHGPHVDAVKFPDAAFVELKVEIPSLGKTATIKRKVSTPNKPVITPTDSDVVAMFEQIAAHPEITLARRDILRFILIEPTKRSEEVQTILRLDDIGQMRAALNTAANKLRAAHKQTETRVTSTRDALQRHLQISAFGAADLLAAVNARREKLGLAALAKLESDTKLDAGLAAAEKSEDFNKASALADLKAQSDALSKMPEESTKSVEKILADIAALEADPSLLQALHRAALVDRGLELVDGPSCPLCDHEWETRDALLTHLKEKQNKSEDARKRQSSLTEAGAVLVKVIDELLALLRQTYKVAGARKDAALQSIITAWAEDLKGLRGQLTAADSIVASKPRLDAGWIKIPDEFEAGLKRVTDSVSNLPDQTATVESQTFLATAQVRLDDYRDALRKEEVAAAASKAAAAAYDAYCNAMESELNALYEDVQEDFSEFYRIINGDDEAEFTAKLTPDEGKLDLAVNFYGRGLFPPGAYHSEGHQDGMGVCLYLALMKRLFGDNFTLALLDDVVMSVDSDHRYQFCKLLRESFPNTQFVITTHDRLWAEQMRHAGLVTSKTRIAFHSWSVDTGPLVESHTDIWTEIANALVKNKVESAAQTLRHHLEFSARHLADNLCASLIFRADGDYDLGSTMPGVLSRLRELYGKAAAAAQSWSDDDAKTAVQARQKKLKECNGASNVEQWAINKAVHYNQWANFGRKDFEPVVAAFRELLDCMHCEKCQSWLYVTPRGASPEALRCSCGKTNLNLKEQ